jgi:hypothetical protein
MLNKAYTALDDVTNDDLSLRILIYNHVLGVIVCEATPTIPADSDRNAANL